MEIRMLGALSRSELMQGRESPRPARILVVDDHPVICEAIATALEQEEDLTCCGTADSAQTALELVQQHRPDIAVVDMSLKDTHGLSLISTLCSSFPEMRVVVYSMSSESAYAERVIRAGARGYISKSESTGQVLEAIRTVRDGRIYLSRAVSMRMLSRMVRQNGDGRRSGIDRLTNQELTVLQMIGYAYSAPEIADRLGVSRKTVLTYQRRVMTKLGLDSMGKLVQHAIQWADGGVC